MFHSIANPVGAAGFLSETVCEQRELSVAAEGGSVKHRSSVLISHALFVSIAASAGTAGAEGVINNRTIGYALTSARWALHQTPDGKSECPEGFNEGPREQFKALFPNGGSVEKTQLAYESMVRYPLDKPVSFPYREAKGPTALGLDLDGQSGPEDFTSPSGEQGIDNQLFRAIGGTRLFRTPRHVCPLHEHVGQGVRLQPNPDGIDRGRQPDR